MDPTEEVLDALARCNAEIAESERLLRAGHPDVEGLVRNLVDWRTERSMILKAPTEVTG